tara:strand:- start:110 stop:421 length:312 start_codon:yes stop_codon:yes gene_type:complete
MYIPSIAVALISTLALVQAHPGHDIKQEIEERAKALGNNPRDISHCAAKLKARGHEERTISRRSALLKAEREKRGLATGLLSHSTDYSPSNLFRFFFYQSSRP